MNTSPITSVTGAALGSAGGLIAAYLGELLGHVEIPWPGRGRYRCRLHGACGACLSRPV